MRKVSIIIPCKEIDLMTEKCIKECLNLNYKDFGILVLPDNADKKTIKKFSNRKIKIIKTGKVKPAFKRNIGMKKARGEFFGFIDSDAYPEKNWLKNSMKYFNNPKIGIVGGPNLTPPEGNFWERVSGYVLSNFWSAGFANIRYKIAKNRFVRELPSCNYISRKKASSEYDPGFLTAEDSEFCFTCSKKGYKVLYAGDVRVYHHRRDTLKGHVKQMFIYGRDIAWLSKKDFSFDKIYYSILGIFVILFIEGIFISIFNSFFRNIFLIFILIYLSIIFLTSLHENLRMTLVTTCTTILTHFSYGIGWLYGLFKKHEQV
ncbi:GalNAc(5)-diNAcBac-PP-undecaprenol beta-1,3-glucosyltransferase [archaeon BMS3Abin17]|nr:GalNAc(5)-diNAcBac-PP-undecaprenol beta-1,3-glucosyltransferase [archaeon BMS3Abin17]HDZ60386.1 glycosyltransferase [Candidatus Pacearchaeota archaeon]